MIIIIIHVRYIYLIYIHKCNNNDYYYYYYYYTYTCFLMSESACDNVRKTDVLFFELFNPLMFLLALSYCFAFLCSNRTNTLHHDSTDIRIQRKFEWIFHYFDNSERYLDLTLLKLTVYVSHCYISCHMQYLYGYSYQ